MAVFAKRFPVVALLFCQDVSSRRGEDPLGEGVSPDDEGGLADGEPLCDITARSLTTGEPDETLLIDAPDDKADLVSVPLDQ